MSGFQPEWLSLREGADHRAVNHALRRELLTYLSPLEHVRVTDLGSGTGSNFRSLAPEIAAGQSWLLVDHDPRLLALAATMTGEIAQAKGIEVRVHEADLAGGDVAEIVRAADLVTAAALFDLVSARVIEAMVAQIAAAGAAFYTVLTYDGMLAWLPEDGRGPAMRAAFNRHQHGDKGFGPAAGPDATDQLAAAFERHGYRVMRDKSPWVLDQGLATLRHETDRGLAQAIAETGALAGPDTEAWLLQRAAAADAVTIVGHEDLLALPAAR